MNMNEDGDGESETDQFVEAAVRKIPHSRVYLSEAESTMRPENDIPIEESSLLPPNMDQRAWNLRSIIQNRNVFVDLLVTFFAIGTWLCVNGTFLQLPLLVDTSPESWSLPSHLSICVQIGNIGPLLYSFLQKITGERINESIAIYILLSAQAISTILAAFFYDRTAFIFDTEFSVALYALTFSFAVTANTSSVLFMPYMGRFREIYLVTYLFGEGLSGLLPSVVALFQGVGGNAECVLKQTDDGPVWEKVTPPPRFGTMEFFMICFAFMICSFTGFLLLDRLKLAKKQYANVTVTSVNTYVYQKDDKTGTEAVEEFPQISSSQFKWMLVLFFSISFIANGMYTSIQSFSTMPYGSQAYHLTATLSLIANPIACFLAVFLPHTSLKAILSLTAIAAVLTVYVFTTAVMSPEPFLMDSHWGSILVVGIWTILIGIVSFVKLSITSVMRAQGGKALVWVGSVSLTGSAVGSVLIFTLITYTTIFKSFEDKCS